MKARSEHELPPLASGLRSLVKRSGWTLVEGLAVLLGCVVSILLVHPQFWRLFRTHLWVRVSDIYGAGDFGGTMYLLGRALVGETGRESHLLSYPDGFAFQGIFMNQVYTRIMGLFVALLGMPLGFNVATLLTLATNGLAIHLAARVAGARALPAAFGGMIGAVLPLILEEVASGRGVTAWWAPSIAGYALCIAAIASWRRLWLVLPGVLLVLLGLVNYGFAPVLLAPWGLFALLMALAPLDRWRLLRALIVLCVGAAVIIPFALPLMEAGKGTRTIEPNFFQQSLSIPALFSFHPLPHQLVRVPGALIPLLLLGCLLGFRRGWAWLPGLVAALLLLTISLGGNPWEIAESAPVDQDMPYVRLLRQFPVLWPCVRPLRYGVAGLLTLCVAWGPAWTAATSWFQRRGLQETLAAAAFLGVMVTAPVTTARGLYLSWPPLPAMELMRGEPVLLDLPIAFHSDTTALQLFGYVQVPRLNPPGVDLLPWRRRLEVKTRPLLTALTVVEDGQRPSPELVARLSESVPETENWGLRKVIIHKREATPEQVAAWSELLETIGSVCVFSDDMLVIWELPPSSDPQAR